MKTKTSNQTWTLTEWKKAQKHLSKDPILKNIIFQYKGEILQSRGNSFETLVRSIVGQQISVKAAASVWQKLTLLIPEMTATELARYSVNELRSCGLSERKVSYCLDLANHFLNGTVNPEHWVEMNDQAVIDELIQVRGIGRWTAEMFLIFHLHRPDVFPIDDLGLQKAVSVLYKKRYPVSSKVLNSVSKNWSPYRSVATWYLWRSLDPIPVEY